MNKNMGAGDQGTLIGCLCLGLVLGLRPLQIQAAEADQFQGQYYSGQGDPEFLQLLDISRRVFAPDAEFQNMAMLYMPAWNGLVEGPTWDAWWIQNSYGTTFCALPFYLEPFVTFLQNSQDLWFNQMGDGTRVGAAAPFNWVAPDGCLCDAARPGWIVYKQGDCRTAIHDWGLEFTAAGLLLQAETLLISRDAAAIERYLPKLERCAAFIESRRDPTKDLFLAGPAGNLLAPSFAGWRRPDGTYGQAYLAGLSVTYIAALDRLIEVEKLAQRGAEAERWAGKREAARRGLALLTTDEGYLVRSVDPDGTRHGVLGALRHSYFEASPNHDAVCFRVVDDGQASRIMGKIASVPELRPYGFILPNYPSYDDMYEKPEGLWAYGTWVNGGHWSTCEARMLMADARFGRFVDVRRSLQQWLTFARAFRLDNPLVQMGRAVYQPREPINLTYDAFGPPAALIRGLFEYLYTADGLTLLPHVPPGIMHLRQHFPIRFGQKRVYLATRGRGPITKVLINGAEWKDHTADRIVLPYAGTPDEAWISVALGSEEIADDLPVNRDQPPDLVANSTSQVSAELDPRLKRLRSLVEPLQEAVGSTGYEVAHARLALACIAVARERETQLASGQLTSLGEQRRDSAAKKLYQETVIRLCEGLETRLRQSSNARVKALAVTSEVP